MAEKHVEEIFSMDSTLQGFHVYKDVWNPENGEVLICKQEFWNLHDPYTVTIVCEDNVIVGQVPQAISALRMLAFLRRNGMILCQVIYTEFYAKKTTLFHKFATWRNGGALYFDIHWTNSVHQKAPEACSFSTC